MTEKLSDIQREATGERCGRSGALKILFILLDDVREKQGEVHLCGEGWCGCEGCMGHVGAPRHSRHLSAPALTVL